MKKYLNKHFLHIEQDKFWFNEYATVLEFENGYLVKKNGNLSKVVRSKKQLKKFLES